MPVMRHLNVGGTTYDTVGEASVTAVINTGTKIATVSIDGTSTDLYAPSGGSSVEPATAAPIVDGTAAVGTSVKYAREDHVHPTDTSRAAASHTHAIGDVTSLQTTLDGKAASSHTHAASDVASGTLDVARIPTGTTSSTVALGDHTHSGYQATLVSGTNIKTVNSTSLLGSGDIAIDVPTASTTNPSMDGTASYGSGTSYARSNHVHPTDTSRAASTHDHGSITSAGAITSDTAAAAGDKLVIADNSDSSKLKRSGITFGTDTTTFLRNDGQWAAAGGGGGGSWTDVTSAWASVNPDATYLTAMTDGTFVYVSGVTDSADVTIPSGYEPLDYHIGVAYDLNDSSADAVVAEAVASGIYRVSGAYASFAFSITYPVATS